MAKAGRGEEPSQCEELRTAKLSLGLRLGSVPSLLVAGGKDFDFLSISF